MKSENGVTLTALVVYIIVATLVVGGMAIVSGHFFSNVSLIQDQSDYVVEYNKFNMFFILDVKDNKTATVTGTTITFENGVKYEYKGNAIYRDDVKIAKNVVSAFFKADTYTVSETEKNLIKVNLTVGKGKKQFQKQIEYVLKYW